MRRRFNSTGRQRIPREAIVIRLLHAEDGGPPRFTADLSALAAMDLPLTAKVVVEPTVRQSSMRFDFGVVGAIVAPGDTSLVEVDRGEAVQFAVKVVDTVEKPGRLLALARHVRPKDEVPDEDRKSILPLQMSDLGEAVWKVQVGPDTEPVMVINNRIPELRGRIDDDPVLRGAVFPIAVREVMRVLLREDVDDESEWVADWREFAETLIGEPLPDARLEPTEAQELIERVVEAFCDREKWATAARPEEELVEADYE